MVHIAVLMMVKNETKRLHITLESIKNFANSLVLFDTGSTDNTIEIAKTFCEQNKIPLRLKQGEFVDFSTSRNVSLDFADSFDDIDYLLLLDTNDELRGGDFLRVLANDFKNKPENGFLCCQEWWSGQHDKYYNVRFIKAHCNWRYRGCVHEYLKTTPEFEKVNIVRIPDNIVIYQDRTQDDDKSGKRFKRDKELLLKDYKKDPTEPRTVFYLAQTCSCLNEIDEAFYYYKIRQTLGGFHEEVFHSYMRVGELSQKLGHEWHDSIGWYIKAFEHSQRAEPLLYIAHYYYTIKFWLFAYHWLKLACSLPYPEEAILFVNRNDYDYKRWHLMGIVAYYVKQYKDGKEACLIAINYCKQSGNKFLPLELDEKNLQFYIDKEQEMRDQNTNTQSFNPTQPKQFTFKKQFIDQKMLEIYKENPKMSQKQLHTKATLMWKKREKDQQQVSR